MSTNILNSLNTVLTVISLIEKELLDKKITIMSQYRSHGYLFNHSKTATVCDRLLSQYRSHGYLFNLNCFREVANMRRLNTVLTVISLIRAKDGTR